MKIYKIVTKLCNDDNYVIITDKNLKEFDLNSLTNYFSDTIYKNILNDMINNLVHSYSCLNNYNNQFENKLNVKKAFYSETDDK